MLKSHGFILGSFRVHTIVWEKMGLSLKKRKHLRGK